MSQETMLWLNTMTLIGFTDKRGNAWHYRENDQGSESNHYPGVIPVDNVLRRLFSFEVVERPIYFYNPGTDEFVQIDDRKAMVTDDSSDVLGVFKSGYQGHQYSEWLGIPRVLRNMENVVSGKFDNSDRDVMAALAFRSQVANQP